MFEILLIFILICNQETDSKSTWLNAIQKCKEQCTTIESNTTLLKQRYLQTNERFWIPKAVYKTKWIEHLGCYAYVSMPNIIKYQDTIGGCQDKCFSNNATFFAHKATSCICLPNFTLEFTTQSTPCTYVVYRTITDQSFSGVGDCMWTSCKYTSQGYVRDQLVVTKCNKSYSINYVCSDGYYVGNFISYSQGTDRCNKQNSILPGITVDSCNDIHIKSQGRATSRMWSSIFRTEYTKSNVLSDQLQADKDPVSCFSGLYSNNSNYYVEEHTPCDNVLPYMCQESGERTHMNLELEKCHPVMSKRDSINTNSIAGIAAGVSVGVLLVIVILVIFAILSRHRQICYSPFKRNGLKGSKSDEQRQNVRFNDVNATEVRHVRGIINSDEYAIINKNTMRRENLSDNTESQDRSSQNAIYNYVSSDFKESGLVYTIPSTEYDRLSHCVTRPTQLNCSHYDRTNVPTNGYNTTMHHVRKTSLLDEYDLVPSDGYSDVPSSYETPVSKTKEYKC